MSAKTTTATRQKRTQLRTVLRVALGVLLTAMFLGQVSDLDGFVRILRDYQLGDGMARVLAGFLVIGEGLAGSSLLWPRASAPHIAIDVHLSAGGFAILVALTWSVLAVQAFARGLAIPNCGCFGVYFGQRLSPWILVQDVSFVSWAFIVARGTLQRAA